MASIVINTEQEFIDIPINHSQTDDFIINNNLDFTGLTVDLRGFIFQGYIDGLGNTLSNITLTRDPTFSTFYLFREVTELRNLIIDNLILDGNNNTSGNNAIIYNSNLNTVIEDVVVLNTTFNNIRGTVNALLLATGNFKTINRVKVDGFSLDNTSYISQGIIYGSTLQVTDRTAEMTNITVINSSLKGDSSVAPLAPGVDISGTGIFNANNNKIVLNSLHSLDTSFNNSGGLFGSVDIKVGTTNTGDIRNNIIKILDYRSDATLSGGIMGNTSLYAEDRLIIEDNVVFITEYYSLAVNSDIHAHIVDTISSTARPVLNNNYYFQDTFHYYDDGLGNKTVIGYRRVDSDLIITAESELKTQALYDFVNFDFVSTWNIDEGVTLPYQEYIDTKPILITAQNFELRNKGDLYVKFRSSGVVTGFKISTRTNIYIDNVLVKSFNNGDFEIGNVLYSIDEIVYNVDVGMHSIEIELQATSNTGGNYVGNVNENILTLSSYVLITDDEGKTSTGSTDI